MFACGHGVPFSLLPGTYAAQTARNFRSVFATKHCCVMNVSRILGTPDVQDIRSQDVFQRYAVYYTPDGALADLGAAWLGWDIRKGAAVPHPTLDGCDVPHLTQTPRKYGLHGTIKPPFYLAEGTTAETLGEALDTFCATLRPVQLGRLEVHALSSFVALVPTGDQTALAALAAQTVRGLDAFRAPPNAAELARRRRANLTPAQDQNLRDWGYPYVMDAFRFHITLTGRIRGNIAPVVAALRTHFAPHLTDPVIVDSLTLVGEDQSGMFHEIKRVALTG